MTETTGAASTHAAASYVRLPDFLDPDELATLASFAAGRAETMAPSTVLDPEDSEVRRDDAYRRSQVDMSLDEVWPLFEHRLEALLPHVRRELDIARFALGSIERQLTAHGDGDFFARHIDENYPDTDGCRMITFVYYFDCGPREFEGGALRLFSSSVDEDGVQRPAEEYGELDPEPNSIVFFAADQAHEVTPVRATGNGPGAARWTVNGWFRASDLGRPAAPPVSAPTRNLLARRYVPSIGASAFGLRPTPEAAHQLLTALWELEQDAVRPEGGDVTYLTAGDPDFLPLGRFGDELLGRLQPLHESWAGTSLVPTAVYGLRIFRRGQRMAMHVDRISTHAVSSMLVVAQDVDEPWPLDLDVRDRRHRLFPQPGQMLIYEGASVPHGHPTPLQGDAFVVAMLHYRPVDWVVTEDHPARRALADGVIDELGGLLDTGPARRP